MRYSQDHIRISRNHGILTSQVGSTLTYLISDILRMAFPINITIPYCIRVSSSEFELKLAGALSVKYFSVPVEKELYIEMQAVACIFLHHHRSSLESIEAGIYDACFHVSAVRWVGGWVCSVHTVAFLE